LFHSFLKYGVVGMRTNMKRYGKWFEGDVFAGSFAFAKLEKSMNKYEKGVMKPTALQTKTIRGKKHSRFYYKPIGLNEF
jgi:hypothetical protein